MSVEKYLKRWAKSQPDPKAAFERQLALMPSTFASLNAMKLPLIR